MQITLMKYLMMNIGKIKKKKNMRELAMITFAVGIILIAFRLISKYNND